jgi:hypothetical protein
MLAGSGWITAGGGRSCTIFDSMFLSEPPLRWAGALT